MKHLPFALAALSFAIPAHAQDKPGPGMGQGIAVAADRALAGDAVAWDFLEGITTEVGPRQAGTEREAQARAFASAWLKRNGFERVAIEPYVMDTWVRGEERAEVTAPFQQPMRITALGNSAATPPQGMVAEVVRFTSYAQLQAAPDGSLAGKIAYITHAMRPTQDGSGYGFAGPARWTGPSVAASKGAIATVIRSIGTENHRTPHTGNTTFAEGVKPIPAGALSNPDADTLDRVFVHGNGAPVMMKLLLTPRRLGNTQSGNVVAEIAGTNPKLPPVLLGCHLDSWDLGTGAIDDGAGCAIIAAAAKAVAGSGRPLRTIRILFAGAEEVGVWGGNAYAKAHAAEPLAVAIESDFGADRIWRFDSNFAAGNKPLHDRLVQAVARFGVAGSTEVASGGEDIGIARDQKTAIIDLQQDGTRYFDLHHTPDDTLDKVDPAQLRQNVAVWTQVVGELANEPGPIATAR
ncbi:MAG: hypothetical protein RLZZ08_1763 [Pseudomonadota bacterium]|jgi:hypothetical protein